MGKSDKILTGLAVIGMLIKALEWLLSWLGNMDLVVSRIEDPGWMGKAINFLFLEPPVWFSNSLLLIAILLLLFVLLKHNEKKETEHPATKKQTLAKQVDLKRTALPSDAVIAANGKHDVWLLDAVHFVVHRNWESQYVQLGDTERLNKLFHAQKEIRQLATDGDLPIWGMNNFDGPLVLIEPDYWQRYNFEFMGSLQHTAHPEEWQTENARPPNNLSIYRSLKTSKQKIEEFFPTEQQEYERILKD